MGLLTLLGTSMNNISGRKLTILGAILAVAAPLAFADVLQLGSFATGSLAGSDINTAMNYAGFSASPAPSSGTASTYMLNPAPLWGAAVPNSTWIGYAPNAGPDGIGGPPLGYYTFTTLFTAAGGTYSVAMELMADDTAAVLLNGSVIVPFGAMGADSHCANSADSCLTPDMIAPSGILLNSGVDNNELTFVVEQAGVESSPDPSGLDFDATFTQQTLRSVPTPEPSSLILLGTGLIGSATMLVSRRRLTS
jgi:PEP-CTERM motif